MQEEEKAADKKKKIKLKKNNHQAPEGLIMYTVWIYLLSIFLLYEKHFLNKKKLNNLHFGHLSNFMKSNALPIKLQTLSMHLVFTNFDCRIKNQNTLYN